MKAFDHAKKHGIDEEDADDNDADEDSGTEDVKDQVSDRCDEDIVRVEEHVSNTALKEDSMSKQALITATTMASTCNKIERGDVEGSVDAQ